jgi:A/G-specific adenine glycosylase
MSDLPSPTERRRLRRRLLAWFALHQRDLPWRRNRNPYRIWVSEIMLQQTQAAAVVPYFERFLSAFPTLRDLAAADLQDVLRLWEGLGYYRRARDLHRAAREMVATHGGRLPRDPDVATTLPGMGRYTVGAVLSQAFELRLPILEANSRRVLCRLFGVQGDPASGPVQRRLWKLAEALLPNRRVGDFNQALMELGALVCTPAAPRCHACPLMGDCRAQRLGLQSLIPARPVRMPTVETREVAAVVRRGNRVLLVKRPADGRWAGLWEFPHGPLRRHESYQKGAVRLARQLAGMDIRLGPEILTLRHSVTHHRITMTCFEADHLSGTFVSTFYKNGKWIRPEKLRGFPLSVPHRRLARAILAGPIRG